MSVIKNDEARDKKGLIDYNCHIFQDALNEVFARNWEKDKAVTNGNGEQQADADANADAASA